MLVVKSFLYLTFNRNCAGFFDKIEIRWKSKKRWKIKKLMAFPECIKVFGFLLWCWVLLTTTLKISTSLAYPTLDSPHIFILQCELLLFFFFFGWVIFFFFLVSQWRWTVQLLIQILFYLSISIWGDWSLPRFYSYLNSKYNQLWINYTTTYKKKSKRKKLENISMILEPSCTTNEK